MTFIINKKKTNKNKPVQQDYSFAADYIRFNLKCSGTCPGRPTDGFKFYLIKIFLILCHVISTSIFCLTILASVIIEELDMNMLLINLVIIAFASILEIVHFMLLIQRKEISVCIDQVDNDWANETDENRAIMMKYYNSGRRITIIACVFLYGTSFSWNITPLMHEPVVVDNVTLPNFAHTSIYYFFDPKMPPYYHFVRLHQLCSVLQAGVIMMNMCCILSTLTLHNVGQYDVLIERVNQISKENESMTSYNSWTTIVKRHRELMRYTGCIENALSPIILMEIARCIIATCVCAYLYLIDQHGGFVVSCMHLFSTLSASFVSFVFCYTGEQLVQKCEELSKIVYSCDWYNMNIAKCRILMPMLFVCQYPKQLTASKMTILSMNTFSEIIKKTMALINVFRTMTE